LLVLAAMVVLIGLIFLMSGNSGGLFAHKLVLRSYFTNAAGLKMGAPVTLEGVTIGNVTHIRVVPAREPKPVEVTMRVGEEYMDGLHVTSTASIAQAGVLGDSYVDITSADAAGPPPGNNAELKAGGSPSIQDVIRSSQGGIEDLSTLIHKLDALIDSLNEGKGTAGQFIKNPELYNRVNLLAGDLHTVVAAIAQGKGTLGKLVQDDTLYTHLDSAVDRLNNITTALDEGKGSAGKFLRDEEFYKNLNSAVRNANELVAGVNAGKGALGKLSRDPEFARKFDDTVTNLDELLKNINEGKGTIGQLMVNRSLYDHIDETAAQSTEFIKAFRTNPKKYLTINLKVF
jgi:phospholipid/cholesterol/gamma-HCH transport system substrate-binding protein